MMCSTPILRQMTGRRQCALAASVSYKRNDLPRPTQPPQQESFEEAPISMRGTQACPRSRPHRSVGREQAAAL